MARESLVDKRTMRVLGFLWIRQIVNGIKRAFSHPVRILGVLFFLANYMFIFLRPMWSARFDRKSRLSEIKLPVDFQPPPNIVIEAWVFGIFAIFSMFLMLSANGQPQAFRAPDVDVMFPTPVKPRTLLVFRLVRDYFASILLPVIIILIGFIPMTSTLGAFTTGVSKVDQGMLALRIAWLAYFLLSMMWISVGYALSLFINRSDVQSDRYRRIILFTFIGLILSTIVYVGARLYIAQNLKVLLELAYDPFVRTAFFPAVLISKIVMAPITGEFMFAVAGATLMIGVVVLSIRVALSQVSWMYDQAAVRGFAAASATAMAEAQKKGNFSAMYAEMAKAGKIKKRRISWIYKLNLRGASALIWRESILQTRGSLMVTVFLSVTAVGIMILPSLIRSPRGLQIQEALYLGTCFFSLMMVGGMQTQIGAQDMLTRVDFLKPLPFKVSTVIAYEVLSKCVIGTAALWIGSLVVGLYNSNLAMAAVTTFIAGPALHIMLVALTYFITVLFPDFQDITQRQFRGLITLLGMALGFLLPTSVVALALILKWPLPIAGVVAAVIALGEAFVLSVLTGRLYASYNPSE